MAEQDAGTLVAEKTVDLLGLLCPLPVIKVSKAIKELEVGQILEMINDDPGAPPDMVAWARQTRHELLATVTEGNRFRFFLRRTH